MMQWIFYSHSLRAIRSCASRSNASASSSVLHTRTGCGGLHARTQKFAHTRVTREPTMTVMLSPRRLICVPSCNRGFSGDSCPPVSSEQLVPSLYGGAAGGPLAGLFYGLGVRSDDQI